MTAQRVGLTLERQLTLEREVALEIQMTAGKTVEGDRLTSPDQ
ncbi:hypothetical protein KGM_205496 [Danaus plexippus plexippus]|uniref:Uncharacterized protein n=1 Tax=Danaus plexippus plexippus TaxID=278856 RepID=A0A212F9Z6_DANPL|nr:hypothetical protein KGM_205496 [Danaus plexippus plexippus]